MHNTKDLPRILIVEDEAIIAKDLQWRLEQLGYIVPYIVSNGSDAVSSVDENNIDLVLMDIMLIGDMDGIKAAGLIRAKTDMPVIYLTAYADEDILERAKITEPFGYMIKPVGNRELQSTIEMALYKHNIDRKMRNSRKWFSTVLSSIGDAVIASDADGKVMFMNSVAERLTGWKQEEARGKVLNEIYRIEDENTGKSVENPVEKILREGVIIGLANHTILTTKDKKKIPVDDSGAPIIDENGKTMGVVLVFHDISERKKAEAAVLQSKQDWENTFNTITDMITIHDKDFNIIRSNKAAEKILGMPGFESGPMKCFKYYHGTESPPERCPSCMAIKTKEAVISEVYEPHLKMYVEIRAIPRFDENNELTGLIHVVRDIIDRKKIEEDVKRARIEWEMTFDNATELITLIDKDFRIIRCNQSFADFVKKPFKEIIGHACTEFLPCDTTLLKQSASKPNIEVKTNKGRWLYVSFCPIKDEKGNFIHAILISTDITDLKNTQQRLMESEDELKGRIKDLGNFYEMAVGRELKMKDLKGEVEKLTELLAKDKKNKRKK